MRIIISVYWTRTTYLSHNRPMSEAIYYRCEYIFWLTLALPFIIVYIYSILILVNWTDTTEVGSNI